LLVGCTNDNPFKETLVWWFLWKTYCSSQLSLEDYVFYCYVWIFFGQVHIIMLRDCTHFKVASSYQTNLERSIFHYNAQPPLKKFKQMFWIMTFEILTVVKMPSVVFWVERPTPSRNICNHLQDYTVSQTRRPQMRSGSALFMACSSLSMVFTSHCAECDAMVYKHQFHENTITKTS
jgi:hypothetical protein